MPATTYDVRVWEIDTYQGKRVTSYRVRWKVGGHPFTEVFRKRAQAESLRAELVTAARRGEAFVIATGLPVSKIRTEQKPISWYQFAIGYADMKWNRAAATSRRTDAEALTAITMHLLTTRPSKPDDKMLRRVLKLWAFNTAARTTRPMSDDERRALAWVETHTRSISALNDPVVLRCVLDGIAVKLDGTPRAPSVYMRWRKTLNTALEYAIERKILTTNPLKNVKWTATRTVRAIDKRVVANPIQVRTIFNALQDFENGRRLTAFFGCLYFAAMRPEEAAALREQNLTIPTSGWGTLHLEKARPFAGKNWTNSGEARDERPLKHREDGETRPVPCPPELVALLRDHIARYGVAPDGRLFVGVRSPDYLPTRTVTLAWQRARSAALSPTAASSPLARTPYDLRHAAVSTWLAAGVPPTKVADWAGHSVEVLFKIYAKCLDGEESTMRARVMSALGGLSDA